MKKLLSLVLVLLLLLSACGQADPPPQPIPEPVVPPASVSEPVKPEPESKPEPIVPASSEVPASVAAPATPAPAATWWEEGLSKKHFVSEAEGCGGEVSYTYVYDDEKKLSYSVSFTKQPEDGDYGWPTLIVNSMKQTDNIGARILPNRFFELVAFDDTKYTGEFYETGILLTRSLPGGDKDTANSVKLVLDKADYQQMIANMEARMTGERTFARPAWLTMLRRSRLVSVTVTGSDGKASTAYTPADSKLPIEWMLEDLAVRVDPGTVKGVHQTSLPDAAVAELVFNNDLVYKVYYSTTQVLVTASGMDTARLYDFLPKRNEQNPINAYAKGQVNPRTGKPVIYLYPTQPTDCKVTVDYPFSYTYPTYNSGWNVTAYPDGRLVNKADGSEHYYLFWEGNKRIDWKFDSGFVVAGKDTEKFLKEKLPALGLTPREYNDFITYWVPRMMNSPYNLITFAGAQYEALAPLTVTPTPDSVLRVHMVYRPLDAPMEIPEQQLKPFVRKGFTVVEWGGTDAS